MDLRMGTYGWKHLLHHIQARKSFVQSGKRYKRRRRRGILIDGLSYLKQHLVLENSRFVFSHHDAHCSHSISD